MFAPRIDRPLVLLDVDGPLIPFRAWPIEEGLPYRSMLGWLKETRLGPDRPTSVTAAVPAGVDEQLPGQTPRF